MKQVSTSGAAGNNNIPIPIFGAAVGIGPSKQTRSLTAKVRDSIPDSSVGRDQRGSPNGDSMNHTVHLRSAILSKENKEELRNLELDRTTLLLFLSSVQWRN